MKNIALIFLLSSNFLMAQEGVVQKIRKHYNVISSDIENCSSKTDCNLYNNSLVVNKMQAFWRGSGNYSKTTNFWYTDIPRYCDECGENGVNVLQKVIIEENVAEHTYHSEYLYLKGNMIFHYLKTNEEEQRRYFKDKVLIRFMTNDSQEEINNVNVEKTMSIQQEGIKLQGLFLLSFE